MLSISADRNRAGTVACPVGGATMRELIEAHDWSNSALGPIDCWPSSLRSAVNLALNSAMPMVVRWTPDLLQIYNDAYARLLGSRHPRALGRPFRECWPDMWRTHKHAYMAVLKGENRFFPRQHMEIDRNGAPEMGWFDMNYSPLIGDDGSVAGLLAVVVERTQEVLHERALRGREAQVRAVLDQMPLGVTLAELPSGRYIYQNAKAIELTGRRTRPGPSAGVAYRLDGRPYGTHDYPVMKVITTGRPVAQEEMFFRRSDGGSCYLACSAAPVVDEEGQPVLIVCTMEDITERRSVDEQQRLLLREVDHRAKNALAVVQTLVRLTRADSVGEFITAVDGRVTALARAHGLLAKSRWSGAEMSRLISEELEPFIRSEPGRAVLSGPSVTVRADATQPLGMVIYELATNATKYGALSVPGGSVAVTWSVGPQGLRIVWQETGGPTAHRPTARGFGTELIEASTQHQLSGSAHLDWRPDGLVCTIVIAPENLAESASRGKPEAPLGGDGPSEVDLSGRRVLVVEDDALLALEVCRSLAELGCTAVGPAGNLVDALRLAATEVFDVAIIDMNLRGKSAQPIAEVLRERGVPYVIATGYSSSDVGDPHVPVVEKPFNRSTLESTLKALVARAR